MIFEVHASYHDALSECPAPVRNFFMRLSSRNAIDIRVGKVQLEISVYGEKIGGFHRGKPKHWYFSRVFVASRPTNRVLAAFFIEKSKPGHQWYQLNDGLGKTALFEAALAEFLGHDI